MEKYYKKYYEDEKWYHLLPIIFLIIVVPLIVRLKIIPLTGAMYDFWNGQKENLDFFSYYKSVWIIGSASFALFMLGFKSYKNDFDNIIKHNIYIPMVVYCTLVILSTVFSKYPEISKWGFADRYEGMYVIISYMAILFVTINIIKKEKHIKILLGALFTGAVILGIIGLFQYIGYDIWKSSFGKSLILPSKYADIANNIRFQFGKHQIYSTLYHLDYVGSYMAMLFPLALTIFMLCKNKILKLLMAFLTLLMAINWLGCSSRAGMVGGVLAIFILLIMANKHIIKYWKYYISILLILVLLSIGLNKISNGYLSVRVNSLLQDIKKLTQINNVDKNIAEKSIPLKDLKINRNSAEIITTTETLKFNLINGQIHFKDQNNIPLNATYDKSNGKIIIQDNRFVQYQIFMYKKNNKTFLLLNKFPIKFNFNITNKTITLVDNKYRPVSLAPVEKWGFEGIEKLATSRGYIWSRAIPLLKNTKILGYGPDTFAIYFPQNDFKGKLYAFSDDLDMWKIVDKAHNLYLQTALSTGCISLIAMLTIFLMYFLNSIKIYFRNDFDSFTSIAGVGIFVAVCGYLTAGFFNDSIVSVAPVFWTLLGMGIGINYMLKPKVSTPPINNNVQQQD